MPKNLFKATRLKITHIKSRRHLPGENELNHDPKQRGSNQYVIANNGANKKTTAHLRII